MSVSAQAPLSNFLYSVGTTINGAGQDRSYIIVDSIDVVSARGKRFAVYGKPGLPTNAGTFTLRGTMTVAPDVAAIQSHINASVPLGQDTTTLANALNFLFRDVPGITNQTLAQKIFTALQIVSTNASLEEQVRALGLGNPAVQLSVGRAFTEVMTGVTTYEIRELNGAGAAGDVIGRVTLTPGAPVVLPAPGRPFQVVTNHPSDHLRVRLRWGTPEALRRVSLLNLGFNLYRIPRAVAEAGNFHITPPSTAQLLSNPNFTKANNAAVMATAELSVGAGSGGSDDVSDRTTYFFADDGHGPGRPAFTNGQQAFYFADGQEFYYFATARDLLGRDGLVSAGGLTRACRRKPTTPPSEVRVDNTVITGSTNVARLRVIWKQSTNVTDLITHYWIYRWLNPMQSFADEGIALANRIGIVPHSAVTNVNSFVDNTTGALTNAGVSNVWYTVRAVSQAACDPVLSPHAGPAWGVLRQRDGPAAATGEVRGSCGIPAVVFQNFVTNTITSDTQYWNLRLTCVRRDPGIAWVQFTITNSGRYFTFVDTVGPAYFPPGGDVARMDFPVPADFQNARTVSVTCVVGTFYEQVSAAATRVVATPVPSTQQRELVFYAGQILATAINPGDPLVTTTLCRSGINVTPDASGMVSFTTSFVPNTTALIQAQVHGVWTNLGMHTSDAGGVFWVSYPDCLIGPIPPFQACVVNLPLAGDCDEHISAATDGAPAAPLKIRFKLTPRTQQYRVYRRADDGPYVMIGQGKSIFDPVAPTKVIEVQDDVMPPSAARLCYYVQLLDEHGNGSPMSFIGCKSSKPPALPRPVLAEPKAIGTTVSPEVSLTWFCPTAGVSRFQVKIDRADNTATPSGFLSAKLFSDVSYIKTRSYLGLNPKEPGKWSTFYEAQMTPRIGPDFGPGPQFTLTASVIPNVPYDIAVSAVDESGNVHAASEVWRFTWTPPVVLATVPWPARPLPPVRASFDDTTPTVFGSQSLKAHAEFYRNANLQVDRSFPVGIIIGGFGAFPVESDLNGIFPNAGTTNFFRYRLNVGPTKDPNQLLVFKRVSANPARNGQSLLPIVVYRQQVTNSLFPRVSGTVTQVSPLLERLPYNVNSVLITIPDNLIGVGYSVIQDSFFNFLFLLDQQPVLLGARYHYYVVRFNAQREPEEVIDAGEVELPTTL